MNNLISIVVPLYNKEEYIGVTVDSILRQSYSNFELIIVNDGSTDNSLNIVEKYDDERIRIITKDNNGVSSARNYGIKEAKYNYIALIDADDTWEPSFLEEINYLINTFPKAGAYGTGYKFELSDGKKIIPSSILMLEENKVGIISDYFKYAIKSPLLTASSIVIKRNIFEDVGYFKTELNRGEDLEMWTRIALNYDIAFSSKILVTYYSDISKRNENSNINITESSAYYSEKNLEKNREKPKATLYYKIYMYQSILIKSYHHLLMGDKKSSLQTLLPIRLYYFIDKLFYKILFGVLFDYKI